MYDAELRLRRAGTSAACRFSLFSEVSTLRSASSRGPASSSTKPSTSSPSSAQGRMSSSSAGRYGRMWSCWRATSTQPRRRYGRNARFSSRPNRSVFAVRAAKLAETITAKGASLTRSIGPRSPGRMPPATTEAFTRPRSGRGAAPREAWGVVRGTRLAESVVRLADSTDGLNLIASDAARPGRGAPYGGSLGRSAAKRRRSGPCVRTEGQLDVGRVGP